MIIFLFCFVSSSTNKTIYYIQAFFTVHFILSSLNMVKTSEKEFLKGVNKFCVWECLGLDPTFGKFGYGSIM